MSVAVGRVLESAAVVSGVPTPEPRWSVLEAVSICRAGRRTLKIARAARHQCASFALWPVIARV